MRGGGSAGAFEEGDKFTAEQSICDDPSDPSPEVVAEEAPLPLPEVTYGPLHVGQETLELKTITQGARVVVEEQTQSLVIADVASVPKHRLAFYVTGTALGAPISSSDQIVAWQELCGVPSEVPHPPSVQPCDPSTLVPEIAPPRAGDAFVIVTKAIPGATIRVFGPPGVDELGNGIASVIDLKRTLVKGEVIYVTQSLPNCEPTNAFSYIVQPE